jgi:DNA primase
MSSVTERIKEALAIHDVVSRYVTLEASGKNYKARCPFHNEKSPSFHVTPEKGMYYCFGCHRGGDIFKFVQEIENISFKEALVILAEQAGVPLEQGAYDSQESLTYKRYGELLEYTTRRYEVALRHHPEVVEYLTTRGLTKETIVSFRIGYAPALWNFIHDALKKKYPTHLHDGVVLGVLAEGARGRRDRFFDRIMFPIADDHHRIVGYSARIFPRKDQEPVGGKYINTQESPLYHKSKILYGLGHAKQRIKETGTAILVEGQMDCILSHQAGLTHTVALSGTACTETQASLLARFGKRVIVTLDGDSAGQQATLKSLVPLVRAGLEVLIAPLNQGIDPADMIQNNQDAYKERIKSAQPFLLWIGDHIKNFGSFKEKISFVHQHVFPIGASIRLSTEREHLLGTLATILEISRDALQTDYDEWETSERIQPLTLDEDSVTPPLASWQDIPESWLPTLKASFDWGREHGHDALSHLEALIPGHIFQEHQEAVHAHPAYSKQSIVLNNYETLDAHTLRTLDELTHRYMLKVYEKKRRELQELIRHKESHPDSPETSEELLEITRELMEVTQHIDHIIHHIHSL